MLFQKIILEEGEGILFDMNLVHAGGDNEVDDFMKEVSDEVEVLIEYELGKILKLNDYTILINSREGANKQTPHSFNSFNSVVKRLSCFLP